MEIDTIPVGIVYAEIGQAFTNLGARGMVLGYARTHRMPQGGRGIKSQFIAFSFHGETMPQRVADQKTEFVLFDVADCSQ